LSVLVVVFQSHREEILDEVAPAHSDSSFGTGRSKPFDAEAQLPVTLSARLAEEYPFLRERSSFAPVVMLSTVFALAKSGAILYLPTIHCHSAPVVAQRLEPISGVSDPTLMFALRMNLRSLAAWSVFARAAGGVAVACMHAAVVRRAVI
jgi:hypothetical protein